MKKIIKCIPFIALLSLASVLGLSNNQKVERADAVSTSYRYFIVDRNEVNGFENSATNVEYSKLSVPYMFVPVAGKADTYKIQSATDTTKYLYMNPLSSETIVFSAEGSQPNGYVNEITIGEYNNKHYFKAYGTSFYLYPRNNNWKSFDSDHTTSSGCLLNIFSVEENAADFVTAMNNIACTDLVNGPAATGENSWEAAASAFALMRTPTKNYLRTLAGDKTKGTIDTVEKALAKYDYIINKYKDREKYPAFIRETPLTEFAYSNTVPSFSSVETNYPIIIATVLVAALSLTSVLILKRKHG